MDHQKNNIYFLKMILKIGLSIICYLFFTLYTVPIYNSVRVYANEKLFVDKRTIVLAGASFIVEVADTPEKIKKGLSERKELVENTGMFFVYETSDFHPIWMKDMNFSIDIIWFDTSGHIVHILEDISPDTFPTLFVPSKESRYVLEIPAGTVKKYGIKLGDTIDLY